MKAGGAPDFCAWRDWRHNFDRQVDLTLRTDDGYGLTMHLMPVVCSQLPDSYIKDDFRIGNLARFVV
jgi:hypothetical protein